MAQIITHCSNFRRRRHLAPVRRLIFTSERSDQAIRFWQPAIVRSQLRTPATDEELKEACRLAQADEFIMQVPDQYDTHIEQGGSNVSGGQKQRLCIARALLKKPKILILDDSTSAVDTKTDAQIRKALREYIPETTKIIIAQRISSVQDADRILVMDGGTICNIGTHEELLKTSEIYREVYTSQNKGGDSDEK